MAELAIQRQIVEAVRTIGGAAFKLSHRFFAGVPDLYVQLPHQSALLLEVKDWSKLNLKAPHDDKLLTKRILTNLTPLQRQFILDVRRATGCAGWLGVHRESRGTYYYADWDPVDAISYAQFVARSVFCPRGDKLCLRITDILLPIFPILPTRY